MKNRPQRCIRIALWLLVCWPVSVQASLFDTHGYGARAVAMANAVSALRGDFAGIYYNPAALTGADHIQAVFGTDWVYPNLDFTFENPDSPPPSYLLPSANLGIHWGALFPLGSVRDIPITLGVGGYLPVQNATRIEVADSRVPQFYRYQAQSDALSINLGLAIEPHPMLSIGAAVHVLGGIVGGSRIEIDLLSRRFIQNELESEVAIETAPILGLVFHPNSDFALSASVRGDIHLPYELTIDTNLSSIGRVDTTVYGQTLYLPQKYSLGSAWQIVDRWLLTADLVWERWSEAPDPSVQFSGEVNIEVLGGESQTLEQSPQDLGAVDTLSPRFGLEFDLLEDLALRCGYAYIPTPLPRQTGATNFVDGHVHQVGLGLGWSVANPLATGHAPLAMEFAGQVMHMPPREMSKREADDTVGSYDAGGPIWYLGMSLRHEFFD